MSKQRTLLALLFTAGALLVGCGTLGANDVSAPGRGPSSCTLTAAPQPNYYSPTAGNECAPPAEQASATPAAKRASL